ATWSAVPPPGPCDDLHLHRGQLHAGLPGGSARLGDGDAPAGERVGAGDHGRVAGGRLARRSPPALHLAVPGTRLAGRTVRLSPASDLTGGRSEEHTSELQS